MNTNLPPNLPPDDRAELEARVTALLLGETTADEAAALRQKISQDPALAKLHDRLRLTLDLVRESAATSARELAEQPAPLKLSSKKREALLAHFKTVRPAELARPRARRRTLVVELAAAAAILLLLAGLMLPKFSGSSAKAKRLAVLNSAKENGTAYRVWAGDTGDKVAGNTWSIAPASTQPIGGPTNGALNTIITRDEMVGARNIYAERLPSAVATPSTPSTLSTAEKPASVPKASIYMGLEAATDNSINGNYALTPVNIVTNYNSIPPDAQAATEIIPVHTLNPNQLVSGLSGQLPPGAIMSTGEAGNSVVLTGSQAEVRKMSQEIAALDSTGNGNLAKKLDVPNPSGQIYTWKPVNGDVADLTGQLSDLFQQNGKSTSASSTQSALTQRMTQGAQNTSTTATSTVNAKRGGGMSAAATPPPATSTPTTLTVATSASPTLPAQGAPASGPAPSRGGGGGGAGGRGGGAGGGTNSAYATQSQLPPVTYTVDPISGTVSFLTYPENYTNVRAALSAMDPPASQDYTEIGGPTPRQTSITNEVQVDARFVSVDDLDSKGSNFGWYLGNLSRSNGSVGTTAGTAPSYQGTPTLNNPSGIFPGPGPLASNPGFGNTPGNLGFTTATNGVLTVPQMTPELQKDLIARERDLAELRAGSLSETSMAGEDAKKPGAPITVYRNGEDEVGRIEFDGMKPNLNGSVDDSFNPDRQIAASRTGEYNGRIERDSVLDDLNLDSVDVKRASDSEAKYKADVAALVQNGRLLSEKGDLDGAEKSLLHALELQPGNTDAPYYLGKLKDARYKNDARAGERDAKSELESAQRTWIISSSATKLDDLETNGNAKRQGDQLAAASLDDVDIGAAPGHLSLTTINSVGFVDSGQKVAMNAQPGGAADANWNLDANDKWGGVSSQPASRNGVLTNGDVFGLEEESSKRNSSQAARGANDAHHSFAEDSGPSRDTAFTNAGSLGSLQNPAPGIVTLRRTNGTVAHITVDLGDSYSRAAKEPAPKPDYSVSEGAGSLSLSRATNSYASAVTNLGTEAYYSLNEMAQPGAFAAVADSAAYGAMALWPLNETGDSSQGTNVAYDVIGGFNGNYGHSNTPSLQHSITSDIIGGFNGTYGANARDGGTNSAHAFSGANADNGKPNTNMSLVAWINPATGATTANRASGDLFGTSVDGGSVYLGPAKSFAGEMSSMAMFSNSLSQEQLQSLFEAGTTTGGASYAGTTPVSSAATGEGRIQVDRVLTNGWSTNSYTLGTYTANDAAPGSFVTIVPKTQDGSAISPANRSTYRSGNLFTSELYALSGTNNGPAIHDDSYLKRDADKSAIAANVAGAVAGLTQFTNGVFQFALNDNSAPAKTPANIIGGSFATYNGAPALNSVTNALQYAEAAKQAPALKGSPSDAIAAAAPQQANQRIGGTYWSMPVNPNFASATNSTIRGSTEVLAEVNPQSAINKSEQKQTKTTKEETSSSSLSSLPSVRNPQSAIRNSDAPVPKPTPQSPVPQPEVQTRDNAFSTFSLNVSDVSFKLAAASLQKGLMPDPASVRTEEFINAFDYRGPEPAPGAAVGFDWERAGYPFAHNRDLLRFAVKTATEGRQAGRPLNLVLLLDKSGSMERADRVAIIREALRVLASQLKAQDVLSVVVFSRTARLWADGVPGSRAGALAAELEAITPEGGTNLEEAMKLAYEAALRHYLANGENRVVLLTDGAANLGDVEPGDLQKKVEANRAQGIALDCFGVGWEDYNDTLLEVLSRNGGGRYGFVNTPGEAATEFAGQLAGALRVAASDVKVQVEFNPARVISYRQIGYAKDQLKKEQFRDNTVKAAQMTVAESGNALYTVELNPAGDGPICTVYVRYREPGTSDYHEHAWAVPYDGASPTLDKASPAMRLAATASAFSEWLAGSPYAGEVRLDPLQSYLRGVPEFYGIDSRPKLLETMLREAKSISGQ